MSCNGGHLGFRTETFCRGSSIEYSMPNVTLEYGCGFREFNNIFLIGFHDKTLSCSCRHLGFPIDKKEDTVIKLKSFSGSYKAHSYLVIIP